MLIQCTKKLLTELKVQPAEPLEEESIFCWHANLLTINRKKTMVLVNDRNRYVIVLYGLKAKDFKKINEIILEGIRKTFQAEGIKDEIIEKYLRANPDFSFTKTKDRTSVARMNKSCEPVEYFREKLIGNESIFATNLSKQVSSLMVGDGKNSYFDPNEGMYQDLKEFAGENIFETKAVKLKITLKLRNHKVWRRIVVPLHMTFDELHEIIQVAFGWDDYHLHEFYIYENVKTSKANFLIHQPYHEEGYRPILNLVCVEEALGYSKGDVEMMFEKGISLFEYLPNYRKLKYVYDFGDNWEHDIKVERMIEDYDVNYPVCLEGEGNTPPEDVGGEPGYEAFLEITEDPNHPEYQHMKEWAKMQDYEEFDIKRINMNLKRI